ncbi:hypothetical protein LTR36_006901 [Oleoguttula mirabilis]|uniref:Queuine tRNA-ribosyltransferase accessory subunit 2 n=1 Tax=Oleoguttula mirabilis TaxID=1507867 RepID=A0AAV9JAS0_9PEZI|nr:hypothetical protein LTR36_006901 [Oleoguttula mirabilis]
MEPTNQPKLEQLPAEMFTIIKAASNGIGPRLGTLALPGRKAIQTPHYLGLTSRGVVPHITQDNFARATSISGVYVGLEDFIEKAPPHTPPLYQFKPPDGSSPLRRFIALPEQTLLVLGARRTPPLAAPSANSNTHETVAVCTAVGFRTLRAEYYAEVVEGLKADIVVGLGDIPFGRALGHKRVVKATDRTIQWMQDHVTRRRAVVERTAQARLFAPLLPVSCAKQQHYIDSLTQDLASAISGLAAYDLASLGDLPDSLGHLPRLGFTAPSTPHDILQHIAHGIDIITIPFVIAATDAGIALDFAFPPPARNATNERDLDNPLPLAIDMWAATHATGIYPLTTGCECYTCTSHHRAYLQHLLAAKELLGWVLLQIHNHHTLDLFFAGVRLSIAGGTFEQEVERFAQAYESRLPEKTGQGPRIRGYQYKSEGRGEAKKNKAPFTMLDDGREKLAESALPAANADASELEEQGFAEKDVQ